MWRRAQERFRTRSLVATIVLILLMVAASVIYVLYVRSYSRQQCYIKLENATVETIDSIEGEFRSDRTMLRMISRIISESDESLHSLNVTKYLNIYDVNSPISDVAILTPENKVIRISGMDLDSTGVLDFNEINEKGECITGLLPDLETAGVYDIRNFVPIRRDGETIAYIYGTVTPENVLNAWIPDIYNGHALVSVIDRDSGIFLIDASGRERTNIDKARINVTDITVDTTLAEALKAGRQGYAVAEDNDTGKTMYYCFLPMHIENWEIMVGVPEEDVYSEVSTMNIPLYIMLIVESLILILYFVYIIHITTGSLRGMERRANMDALTGLQNRNRYEYFCQHLQQGTDGLACIYFDVNGLHELNNTKGHLAGDEMLKTVALQIVSEFGESNTYRIGGDEFVAFRYERSEEIVRNDLQKVVDAISAAGYHVACGLAMATPDKKLLTVIKAAEEEMYADKAKYYESIGKEMRG